MDERKWYCPSCGYREFFIPHEQIKIVKQTQRRALVEFEGRAHALKYLTHAELERFRSLDEESLPTNGYNVYVKPKRRAELYALLDEIHGVKNAP